MASLFSWIVFFPICLVLVYILYRGLVFLRWVIRYQRDKLKYRQFYRIPGAIPRLELYNKPDPSKPHIFEYLKTEDGKGLKKFVNVGPFVGGVTILWVNDAEAIGEILSDPETYPKAELYRSCTFLGDGLVTSYGPLWKRERKLITPLFHFGILKLIHPKMVEVVQSLINHISSLDPEKYYSARELFSPFAMEMIVQLAFGGEFDSKSMTYKWKNLNRIYNFWSFGTLLFGPIWSYIPITYGSGYHKRLEQIYVDVKRVISNRRKKEKENPPLPEERKDLISVLINSTDENGKPIDDQLIVDEILTFLFAGHDTTSVTLSWLFHFLSQNKSVTEKVQAEIDQVLEGHCPTSEDLVNLKYLKNSIQETLRMSPPFGTPGREPIKDVKLCGIVIPKGTYLEPNFHACQNDPSVWGDPENFRPERWVEEETIQKKQPFSFVPFSAGQRNCIGQKYAMQEMLIIASMVLQKFDLKRNESKPVTPFYDGLYSPFGSEIKFLPRKKKQE